MDLFGLELGSSRAFLYVIWITLLAAIITTLHDVLICAGCNNYRRQMAVLRAACRRFSDGGTP